MKKFLLVVLIGAFAMPMFQSCKKGPNDPGISLKSRKSRLVGEWTITKGKSTENDAGTITTITITESTYSETSGGVTFTGTITTEISIVKDGTYKWKETLTINGTTRIQDQEGNWWFLGANTSADTKNKQCVAFQCTKFTVTAGTTTTTSTFEAADPVVFYLDELKSKEIIMKRDYTRTGTTSYSLSEEYTLTIK